MALFGTDPLDELLIPDGTHVEEHDLVTDGDVIVASQSAIEFGVRGGNVIAGERVRFDGHIEAEGDCRLDTWCAVADDVLVGEDAYLGERVHIAGELRVAGNLDIGDDVQIDEGFEANGWIVIRNPMPTIVFLFIYLSQLLRLGEEDAAEQLLAAMTDADNRESQPVLIPRGSRVGDDAWQVSTPGRIGDDCRLHGNIRAQSLVVGRDNEIFGSLRAREGITVGAGTDITGNVTTREGTVRVGPGTTIRGDLAGAYVEVHREATVEGAIRASEEMSMVSDPVLDDTVVAEIGGEETADGADGDEADAGSDEETDSSDETDEQAVDQTDTDASETGADQASETGGPQSATESGADSTSDSGVDETDTELGTSVATDSDAEGTSADSPDGGEPADSSADDVDPGDSSADDVDSGDSSADDVDPGDSSADDVDSGDSPDGETESADTADVMDVIQTVGESEDTDQ